LAEAQILLNDFKRQWANTGESVLEAVRRVGASGWYVLGREVVDFERTLAGRLGRTHAIGCASGLDAIEIGLRACGVAPGSKVLTTPLSAFATTLAILRAGAVPAFVDVDEHGLLDLDLCRTALAKDPAIRAMVPVHLYGHALNLSALAELRDRFELTIVEDCAQAIGAVHSGQPVGSVGQAAALSFYPTKNLGALGDGGAVTTDDAGLAARCRSLRDYGQSQRYLHDELGLNSRLDELHAAILGHAFLPKLEAWTARRREVAQAYLAGIHHPEVRLPALASPEASVWHLFPVCVPAHRRASFMEHTRAAGVLTAIHYPRLIPDQPALRGQSFEILSPLPRATALVAGEVSLPIHPFLTDDEVSRVVAAVCTWPVD
jgi:dTDP-3-amino-3,4,6-trideoxy-alpha-D-glucose transaminase